ncbi:MAG: hypothetical protein ACREO3_00715, partial [Arenimonas sp.]
NRNPGYRNEEPAPPELNRDVRLRDPNATPRPVIGERPWFPPRDRNVGTRPRDPNAGGLQPAPESPARNGGTWSRDPNAMPSPLYGVRPAPQPRVSEPRDRNDDDSRPAPAPRNPEPRDRSDDGNRSSSPPASRRESSDRGDDRNARRDGGRRPALQ